MKHFKNYKIFYEKSSDLNSLEIDEYLEKMFEYFEDVK